MSKIHPKGLSAYIEMVSGSRVKYNYDKRTKRKKIARILPFPLPAPFNYGFLPDTITNDKGELDAIVVSNRKLAVGSKVGIRVIGILYMKDEKGEDDKIIAVDGKDPTCASYSDVRDLPYSMQVKLEFLKHNKDRLPGKWVRVRGFGGVSKALLKLKSSMKPKIKSN